MKAVLYTGNNATTVSPTNVVAAWDFSEGAGTIVADDSGGGHTATFASDGATGLPIWVSTAATRTLKDVRLNAKLNFKKANRDSLSLKAAVDLPADYDLDGKILKLDIGGVAVEFTLDSKGKAKVGRNSAKMKRGSLAAAWADEGLVDADIRNLRVRIRHELDVGAYNFASTRNHVYNAKSGKWGEVK